MKVVTYRSSDDTSRHELESEASIARTLARLLGAQYAGEYDASRDYNDRLYYVPSDTLVGTESARNLGVQSQDDLFGGVVPVACAAHKTIVHPMVSRAALCPRGWPHAFADGVRRVVLPGFTAYTLEDARRAALRLLAGARVRLKPGEGVGGHGQTVVSSAAEVDAVLAKMDRASVERRGLVAETNLDFADTYSIGQVRVGGITASYCGTQRQTTDNFGRRAYGGSDLLFVRGGFDDLLQHAPLGRYARAAVERAKIFDAAAEALEGFIASRRNYDAVCGRDASGRRYCRILEQSWRVGGASGAEVAALAALKADAARRLVRACSTEAYGTCSPPADVDVHFSGIDERLGALVKYTELELDEAPG